MALNTDKYLARRFDISRQNCWHVVREAWRDLTGDDLGDLTPEEISAASLIGQFADQVPRFQRIDRPADPSIVLMRHKSAVPHVGIYHAGRVLQMSIRGPSYLPLASATAGFTEVEFYK